MYLKQSNLSTMKEIAKLVIAIIGLGLLSTGCRKQSETSNSDNGFSKNDTKVISQSNQSAPLTYAEAIQGLTNMGTVLVNPGNITNYVNFTGYDRIERYYVQSTNTYYNVFVWDTNEDVGMDVGMLSCSKSWYTGEVVNGTSEDEGCYDSGSQCDLELRNGEYILVCCDDVVV